MRLGRPPRSSAPGCQGPPPPSGGCRATTAVQGLAPALAAAQGQAPALAAAQGQAPPDARATFAGLTRHKLLKRAARIELPTASKKLKRFRRDTQKLIAEKTERGHWAGFHETLPQLRRRSGTSQMIVCEGPAAPRAEGPAAPMADATRTRKTATQK